MQTQQPTQFVTNNAALAFALFIAGIPPLKIHNEYDDALLDKLRVPGLKTAQQLKKLGRLKYFYDNSEKLAKLNAAFDEQTDAIDANQQLPEMPSLSPEDAIRVACYTLKNRQQFLELAFLPAVMMYVNSKGEVKIETEEMINEKGEKVILGGNVSHPGFSIVSMNLAPEKIKTLKVNE